MKSSKKRLPPWRSRMRCLFRIFMVTGFIVQSILFFEMYSKHPSMLQLDVDQPQEVDLPAFTVCNLNEVRASEFCRYYPQKCGNSKTVPDFCTRYVEYCKLQNGPKMVPIIFLEEFNLTRYEQQTFGHQWEDLVVSCVVEIDGNEQNCPGEPILVPALSHSIQIPFNCFMMFSLYGQPDAVPEKVPRSAVIRLHLNVEVGEYHPYHLTRGSQISIHSPYHVPSPMSGGQLLNMGNIYRIYLRLAQQNLLPAPYSSNCTDYMSQWHANGGKGPITQKMCTEKCKLDKSLELYGCAEPRIDYPHNETMCEKGIPRFHEKARAECSRQCTMPCKISTYELQVQIADSEGQRGSCVNETDLSCVVLVQIFMENMEITTFTYTPKFEAVGILSWIGGYVGLWLGISLLHVYDFLEKWFFYCITSLQKRSKSLDLVSFLSTLAKTEKNYTYIIDGEN
ncbi:acid-sensing ion channel 4-A-like [Uloborus diversus]|uniref:acid-sensing ion channel 4-A-like n=1 Tax=Uloborus diversus TaxID=327109 RepID=UPI002408FA80|nr:acid-sensing ion channel 4-A-like [Uloborus diversus]